MTSNGATLSEQRTRRTSADTKIEKAILAIARDHGLAAVTIDTVAAHSGVAKTTIYRRYDDRLEMLLGVARDLNFEFVNNLPTTYEGAVQQLQAL